MSESLQERYAPASTSKFEHIHTSNPPKTYSLTVPYPDPGIYVCQFCFINSLE